MRRNIDEDVDMSFLTTQKEKNQFQKYNDECEKMLNQMEKSKMWSDILQNVQSFAKYIKANQKYPVVPAKQSFMRRMAQVLDPQIPSGVHSQVLDLFVMLFERIGQIRLFEDIWCFTPGLFPLIRSGSTDIRVKVLDVVKKYLINTIKATKNIQKAFIISVVVGMEEPSMGIKDKTLDLMDELKKDDEKFFWETSWDVLRTNAVSRKAMLIYMNLKLDLPLTETQIPDKELLFYAIVNSLNDEKQLVVRDMLDVLCTRIKLDSKILDEEHFEHLIERMLLVLTKRESGLTRRVNFYLLGLSAKSQDVNKEETMKYFKEFSETKLVTALSSVFLYGRQNQTAKIVSIYEELLSKQDIAEVIIGKIMESILVLLQDAENGNKKSDVLLIVEFLSDVNVDLLFEYITGLLEDINNKLAVEQSLVFFNTYHGDEERNKKVSVFRGTVVEVCWNRVEKLVVSKEIENETMYTECFKLIKTCLQMIQNEGNFNEVVLKSSIRVDELFEKFVELHTSDILNEKVKSILLEFYDLLKLHHVDYSQYKQQKRRTLNHIEVESHSEETSEAQTSETPRTQDESKKVDVVNSDVVTNSEIDKLKTEMLSKNQWLSDLKKFIIENEDIDTRLSAARCFYEIWKKDERDVLSMNDEVFIKRFFDMLWNLICESCYVSLTDVVLFFHAMGNVYQDIAYEFITTKMGSQNEEEMFKFLYFWKNSTVVVYDTSKSVFNKATLLFLRYYNHQQYDPYFLDFLHSCFNVETIERVVVPLIAPFLIPLNQRTETKYAGFEVNNNMLITHLEIIHTLFSCANHKLISSLESAKIPQFLLKKFQSLEISFENVAEPSNLLTLLVSVVLLYLKANKNVVDVKDKVSVFNFQKRTTDILIGIFMNYSSNDTVKKMGATLNYTILLSALELISSTSKLQLHVLTLIKCLMKLSDISESDTCITKYPLFLQVMIGGIVQDKHMYRLHFLKMTNECISYLPQSVLKDSIILLIQAVLGVMTKIYQTLSPHVLVLHEEITPVIETLQKLLTFSLNISPVKSPFEQQQPTPQPSPGQQIGNAMIFIPMLVASVFVDVKDVKEKRPTESHFLAPTLKRLISAFFELYSYTKKEVNSFLIQTQCVEFLKMIFKTFPVEFVTEYLTLVCKDPVEHIAFFKSFSFEEIGAVVGSLLLACENNAVPSQVAMNFVQIIITQILSPVETYRLQLYFQSVINKFVNNDELTLPLIHTLKVFLETISKSEQPNKVSYDWLGIVTTLVSKYMLKVQKWKEDITVKRKRSRMSSTDFQSVTASEEATKSMTDLKVVENPEDLMITPDILNFVVSDIIPIISLAFDDNSLSTMIDLGRQFENVLMKPSNNTTINTISLNILNELAKKNQLIGKWSKLVMNVFYSDDFFKKSPELLDLWKFPIFNVYTMNNNRGLLDLIYTIGKSNQLFVSKETESTLREKVFKRLAFIFYAGENETLDSSTDQNQLIIEIVLDKIIDSIKVYPTPTLYVNAFLLLRVLLLKCSFTRLRKRIPTIINELISIFNLPFERDGMVILSGLHLLDMLQIIPTCPAETFSWIFMSPLSPSNLLKPKFLPLVPLLFLNDDKAETSVTPPDPSLKGIELKRELIVKDKKFDNDEEFTVLRGKLAKYPENLFNMLSRSDTMDFKAVSNDIFLEFTDDN